MPREDSVLYTGLTSASTLQVRKARKARENDKEATRATLSPSADIVLAFIQAEKDAIPKKIWDLISLESTADSTAAAHLALKMYDSYLSQLSVQLTQALRPPRVAKKPEAESVDE